MDSKKAEEMIKTGKLLCDIDAALMIIPIFCEPIKNFYFIGNSHFYFSRLFLNSTGDFL